MKFNYFLYALVCIFLLSCNEEGPTEPIILIDCESDAIEIAGQAEQAAAVKDFGFKLMRAMVEEGSHENTIISPLSIYSALLLAYEGSACETKKQIMRTLELGEGNQNVNTSDDYRSFLESISPTEGNVSLTNANACFVDPSKINTSVPFRNTVEENYSGRFSNLDFTNPTAKDVINEWAEENTNGKIKEVIQEISADEIAFLMNAIYFKGDWTNGFDEAVSQDRTFYLQDGTALEVPTMNRDAACNFFIDDNYQVVDLDIKGDEYAVSFISSSNLDHVNSLLNNETFLSKYEALLSELEVGRLLLTLPKFEMKGKKQLKSILSDLGMSEAFTPGLADFQRMGTAAGNIFLTRVLHDTYIKVDEKGIEGAAVTTLGIGVTSVPPSMTFDKPFAFVLRHKETGVPIFIGKVENPLE